MKIVTYKAEELNPFLPETKARYDEVVQYKKDFTTIAKSDKSLTTKAFYARTAVEQVVSPQPGFEQQSLKIAFDDDGNVIGAISYSNNYRGNDKTYISSLGSVKPGVGTALVKEVAKDAASKNEGLELTSLAQSTGFYDKLGFTPTTEVAPSGDTKYVMEANKVRTFANDPNSYDKLVDSVIKEEVEAFTKDVCDKLADAAPGAFLSGAAGAAIGGFSFHLLRETAAKYAEDYKAKLDKGYSVIHGEKNTWVAQYQKDLFTKISNAIKAGVEEGMGYKELSRKLREVLPEEEKWKLDRIARTEMTRAQFHGAQKQYQRDGVEYVEWVSGSDPCEECAEYGGEIYPVDELPSEIPVHPHCTCAIKPLPIGWRPEGESSDEEESPEEELTGKEASFKHQDNDYQMKKLKMVKLFLLSLKEELNNYIDK